MQLRRKIFSPLVLAAATLALLALAPAAQAKQAVDFFGGNGTKGGQFAAGTVGVAVNDTGAGPGDRGDVYVVDQANNRIQRFGRDDHGTPGEAADDTYFFISAWGAGVQGGGSDYEVCSTAAICVTATATGGNGTGTGNGALSDPRGVAVDQDSGQVYVSDTANFRVNVYDGVGNFLRSFGWDVVESGPGDAGAGYEVCIAADGDTCKAGVPGGGEGQVGNGGLGRLARQVAVSPGDGNPATGTVFLADTGNRRIGTYGFDGSSPASFGSAAVFDGGQPEQLAVDSRGIVYASNRHGDGSQPIERYDTENANGEGVGFLEPIPDGVNEVQEVTVSATAGTFKLTFEGEDTVDLPYNARPREEFNPTPAIDTVEEALKALPSVALGSTGDNRNVRISGGPGNAGGSTPYRIEFDTALGAMNVSQMVASNGSTPLSGGTGVTVATAIPGQSGLVPYFTWGLGVDPDADGAGPDADVLYVQRSIGSPTVVQQLGPINQPGLIAPSVADDERHGTIFGIYSGPRAIAAEPSTGRLYVAADGIAGAGVYVLDESSPTPPAATLDTCGEATTKSIVCEATIDPNGPPATRYHLEYVDDATYQQSGFEDAISTPEAIVGAQEDPQEVETTIEPAPFGLQSGTTYHVRLIAGRRFATQLTSAELTEATLAEKPLVETTGTPLRSASVAQLLGRVNPRNTATTYHFEYGADGSCAANPCTSTPERPAGAGASFELVAESVQGLEPATTYHYRLVADNAAAGPPTIGEDETLTTRASNAPLTHGHFPGPAGSDRAWEQVSLPDAGGNPVGESQGFADDGDSALYGVIGGTPLSDAGSLISIYYAERPPGAHPESGWRTRLITPPRAELGAVGWPVVKVGAGDLSSIVAQNSNVVSSFPPVFWRLRSDGSYEKLFAPVPPQVADPGGGTGYFATSEGSARTVLMLKGGELDPAHPAAAASQNLYDVSTGSPQLLSLLPGEAVSACGVIGTFTVAGALPNDNANWLSSDGERVFFLSQADGPCGSGGAGLKLFMREIDAEQSTQLSPFACDARLAKATPVGVFFTCAGELYRYNFGEGTATCLTCALDAKLGSFLISEDGSRAYFTAKEPLQVGADDNGAYRLDTASSAIAYLGHATSFEKPELSADGSEFFFRSSNPAYDQLGGQTNGGFLQYYRYSDADRSLVCVSCPADGSVPVGDTNGATGSGHNATSLATDGTFAFSTPTPLVGADQNTPPSGANPDTGVDAYEWRDGRQLLVSDGLTNWPPSTSPEIRGISPSGRDVYFAAPAQYTRDALDGYRRLYDARIGGGIAFPPDPVPCPLEVCQGTPKGAPEEQEPASANFAGVGNPVQLRSCAPAGRSAARLARRVKRLRAAAAHSSNRRRATTLSSKARRLAKTVKKRSRVAKRCRRANHDRRNTR